jgi:prepilin-type N-terminal cleavage/methylation domain-containing protein
MITIKKRNAGFTLLELMVIITIVAILAVMLLPAHAAALRNSQKITCINNLKQIGIAFHIWAGNNDDRFPMAVPSASGGAFEYINSRSSSSLNYNVANVFKVMNTQLQNPKVCWCPADTLHISFTTNWASFGTSTMSYFIGGDANESDPQMVLSGDDNIGSSSASAAATSRFISAQQYSGAIYYTWTADTHQSSGNLLLTDGSVQPATLTEANSTFLNGTNTVSRPWYNFFP